MKRLARIPVVALVLAILGVQASASSLTIDLGAYDEGLLATNGFLLGRGQIPCRDFYSNYPPGSFLLVRACIWLSGDATIHAMRVLALGIRFTGATLAAILVGRLTRGRTRVATFAAILLLQSQLDLVLFAYVTALTLALGGVLALATDRPGRARFAVSGVLFGLVSWFRQDLFVYGTLVATGLLLLSRLAGRPLVGPLPRAGRRAFAVGLLSAVLPFWGAIFLLAGPSRVLHDLAIDQAIYVMPARVTPLPSFRGDQAVGLLNWTIPSCLTSYATLGLIALALAVACGAANVALQRRWTGVSDYRPLVAALLLALAVATAPQAVQRADWVHVAFAAPTAVACVFGALGSIPALSEVLLLAAFVPFIANRPSVVAPGEILARLRSRPDETFIPAERRTLTEAIHRLAGPDDRIFVGCTTHTRVLMSYVSIYYESHRLPSTRIQQFDPGIVPRDDIQQQMIEELGTHHPAAVVLASDCTWDEPNASKRPGSDRLDRYIATHYVAAEQVGRFQVLRPR